MKFPNYKDSITWKNGLGNIDGLNNCTCSIPQPKEELLIKPYKGNESYACKVSYGESGSVYPLTDAKPINAVIYNPSKWNVEKTKELLKARAAMRLVAERGELTASNWPKNSEINITLRGILAYHLTVNFPPVDSVIKNDTGVKWFHMHHTKGSKHRGISQDRQELVKEYGPFYNNAPNKRHRIEIGLIYIAFYKLKS